MKKGLFILLLSCLLIIPFGGVSNAELDMEGVCKVTQLKDDYLLLQKGVYKRDGNHTCDSVDLYKNERDGHTFIKTLTCEEAEKYYKKYRGDEYVKPK